MPTILSDDPRPDRPTLEVVSSGGVVFKEGKALLLRRRDEGLWCFPKGKLSGEETVEEAALREIEEETGLKCTIGPHIIDIEYSYYWPHDDVNYEKKVVYFLAFPEEGELELEETFDEYRWCTLEECLKLLYYENDKAVIEEAFRMLDQT